MTLIYIVSRYIPTMYPKWRHLDIIRGSLSIYEAALTSLLFSASPVFLFFLFSVNVLFFFFLQVCTSLIILVVFLQTTPHHHHTHLCSPPTLPPRPSGLLPGWNRFVWSDIRFHCCHRPLSYQVKQRGGAAVCIAVWKDRETMSRRQ